MIYPMKKQPYAGNFSGDTCLVILAKNPTHIREVIHDKHPGIGSDSRYSVDFLVSRLADLLSDSRPEILAQGFFSKKQG
jgi:hypothetical protein